MKRYCLLLSAFFLLSATNTISVAATDMPSKGTRIFSESFENTSWSSRDWYDGTSSQGIAAGGYSGNALKWTFSKGATRPDQFSSIRNRFSARDEFLIEYYLKFDSGWRGSGRNYHPHFLHIISDEDTAYQGLSRSNSSLYFETIASISSPYSNYPVIAHQDSLRVNTSLGNVPNNLVGESENRSANNCNTPYKLSGASVSNCYRDGSGWYSSNTWNSAVNIPANTWTKITSYIKTNTFTNGKANFDGIMKLWVGNTLAISSTNVMFTAGAHQGAKWDKVTLAPWIGDGSPLIQTMWIDELSIWTVVPGSTAVQPPRSFRVVN